MLDHQPGILGLGVDAGADGRAADVHLAEPVGGLGQLLAMPLHGVAVRGELLAEPDRRRVLEMGAAGLDDRVELDALGQQRVGKAVERGQQAGQRGERGQPHGGGNDVVGALRHVDMIVGMHRRVRPARRRRASRWPGWRAPRYVHVVAGPRAGLIDVHDELIPMLPAEDLVRGLDDRVGQPGFETAGLLVRERRRAFDPDDRVDEERAAGGAPRWESFRRPGGSECRRARRRGRPSRPADRARFWWSS